MDWKKAFDWVWNLKFLTGYRTTLAQVAISALAIYQAAATSDVIARNVFDLPDINAALYVSLTSYFAFKVAQFAQEHQQPGA